MRSQLLNFRKRLLGFFCLAIAALTILAGLWPFNLWPANQVEWLKDRNGVHFYGRGIIVSPPATTTRQDPLLFGTPITFEIWLQADGEPDSYLTRILSLYGGEKTEDCFLGQWKSYLILRSNTIPENNQTFREIAVKNALPKGQRRFITITSDEKGTCIYVAGKLERVIPNFLFAPKGRKALYRMILGNSPRGKDYWQGNLFGVGIYQRSLTADQVSEHFQSWMNRKAVFPSEEKGQAAVYLFNERGGTRIQDQVSRHDLLLLPRFTAPQKNIVTLPSKDSLLTRPSFEDTIINISGFIPFGLLTLSWLPSQKLTSPPYLILIVIFLGGLLSLAIELIQVYLPSPYSQLVDLLSNILGTFLGAFFFHSYISRR
jgi:VanZ family protein